MSAIKRPRVAEAETETESEIEDFSGDEVDEADTAPKDASVAGFTLVYVQDDGYMTPDYFYPTLDEVVAAAKAFAKRHYEGTHLPKTIDDMRTNRGTWKRFRVFSGDHALYILPLLKTS
jgi:hypothetical protein